jgi:hypothetical protein
MQQNLPDGLLGRRSRRSGPVVPVADHDPVPVAAVGEVQDRAPGVAEQEAVGAGGGRRPGPARILAERAAAWARLWTSDIVVPGQPALLGRVRAAQFYLLASARPDVDWSASPAAGPYELQAHTAGAWRTVATVPATAWPEWRLRRR